MSYWEMAFMWGWATADQLREVTGYEVLTEKEFERITGEKYVKE